MRAAARVAVPAAIVVFALMAVSAPAHAQGGEDAPSLRPHRVTVGGGVTFSGGYDIGDQGAVLRGNAVGATPPPFTLFRSETSIGSAAGAEATVGFALARSLSIELGFAYSRPGLTTRVSQDDEAPAMTLDAERLAQYVVDVGLQWQLPRPVVARRLRPFVTGGGGYLRQLYSERTLAETGRIYFAGGGVRYWIRGGDGTRRSLGLRGDVRAQWRTDGVEFAGRTRVAPVVAIHVFAEL